MEEDPSTLSTAGLKRALAARGVDPARLAQCIERPDYEQLYREIGAGAPPASAAAQPAMASEVPVYKFKDEPSLNTSAGTGGVSWQWHVLILALGLYYVLGTGGGGGGGGNDPSYNSVDAATDTAYISGHVAEVTGLPALRELMTLHRDGTGLPVVIDFYSPYCGPCRQIAPKFTAMANEYKGRAAFVKVDVNSAYDVSAEFKVRAMPTFHFYYEGKLVHSFRGADTRSLAATTDQLARRAEKAGTYVEKEVTGESLRAFYTTHEPAKVGEVDGLIEKYAGPSKTAKLIRTLRKKYSAEPETSEVSAASPPSSADARATGRSGGGGGGGGPGATASLGGATVEELRAELQEGG